ncbi:MAG TPA: hypothetical protein VL001_07000 [Candidimonas sp.]|nr:hypothetical protein [Candidimonas sp.]
MKFKPEAWRALQPPPFHEGEYEVKLDSGEIIRAMYQQTQWLQDTSRFAQWRGQRLKGMKQDKPRRRVMDRYRANAQATYSPAAQAAHFLARRAVSLGKQFSAYQFYLVVQTLDPALLGQVDTQWIAKLAAQPSVSKEKILARHHKVDAFFSKRGGHPTRA